MFEKNLNMSYLLDFYGNVLSERKLQVMRLYYNEDLSLGEIAEQLDISRQGVRDIIKKAESELLFYEERLQLASRFQSVKRHADNIISLLQTPEGSNSDTIKREVNDIIDELSSN